MFTLVVVFLSVVVFGLLLAMMLRLDREKKMYVGRDARSNLTSTHEVKDQVSDWATGSEVGGSETIPPSKAEDSEQKKSA